MRDAGSELDNLDAARDLALGIGQGLAVLLGDDLGQLLPLLIHQFAKAHQNPGTPQWRRSTPRRQRRGSGRNGSLDIRRVGQRHMAHDLTSGGVGDFAIARGLCSHRLAADP